MRVTVFFHFGCLFLAFLSGLALGGVPELEFKANENGWRPVPTGNLMIESGSALDLSGMNHRPAGVLGHVVSNDAGQLAFESNQEACRFLSVSGRIPGNIWKVPLSREEFERRSHAFAKAVANQGYNMLRLNGFDNWIMTGSTQDMEPNPEILDKFDKIFADLKDEGVYIQLSLFCYGNFCPEADYNDAFKKRDMNKILMLLGEKKMRERFAVMTKKLLNHVNPYTGLALKDDPQLAILEIYNEIDLGWWRMQTAGKEYPEDFEMFKSAWKSFIAGKYGNVDKKDWPESLKKTGLENPDIPYHWCSIPSDLFGELAQFLHQCSTDTMNFCKKIIQEQGYNGVITCNLDSTFGGGLGKQEQFDFIDHHSYYVHPTSWIVKGSVVGQESPMAEGYVNLRSLCGTRVMNHSFGVGEYNLCFWNPYQYELPFAFTAYAAYQDFSAMAIHENSVLAELPQNGYESALTPFYVGTNPILRAGEFLNAMLFRRQDIKPGLHTTTMCVSNEFLWTGDHADRIPSTEQTMPALVTKFQISYEGSSEKGTWKPSGDFFLEPVGSASVSGHAWFTKISAGDNGGFSFKECVKEMRNRGILPEDNQTDPEAGIYQTDTGEITLDTKNLVGTIVTERTVAVASPAHKADGQQVGAMKILDNSVDSLVAMTAIDNLPLAESTHQVLVYATRAVNDGMKLGGIAGEKMEFAGKAPIILKSGSLTVKFVFNAENVCCYALNIDGKRLTEIPVQRENDDSWILSVDTAELPQPSVFFELCADEK